MYWSGNLNPESPSYKTYSVKHSMEQERYYLEVSYLDYFYIYYIMYTFVNNGEYKSVLSDNKDTGKLICTGFRMDIILYKVQVC
jgi:hypothetical protein